MRITGGVARGRRLMVPRVPHVRPTSDRVRGALFQLLGEAVAGSWVLDLYAGTGSLGIEALSREAVRADFVEQDFRLCRIIERNLENAGFQSRGNVHHARVEQALEILEGPYQLALLDPPYEWNGIQQIMEALSRPGLLAKEALVVMECSGRVALAERYGTLKHQDHRRYGDTALWLYGLESE